MELVSTNKVSCDDFLALAISAATHAELSEGMIIDAGQMVNVVGANSPADLQIVFQFLALAFPKHYKMISEWTLEVSALEDLMMVSRWLMVMRETLRIPMGEAIAFSEIAMIYGLNRSDRMDLVTAAVDIPTIRVDEGEDYCYRQVSGSELGNIEMAIVGCLDDIASL